MRENEQLLLQSQNLANIGSYEVNLKTSMWKGSAKVNEILGINEAYPHTLDGWLDIIQQDWRTRYHNYHLSMISEKKPFDYEYKINRISDNKECWIHGLGNVEHDNQGNPTRVIGTIQDITKRKKADEEIIYLNQHDVLTGLYNRRFYEEEITRIDYDKNLPISILIGDVNGLKLINDAFGHAAGDKLLQKAATVIKSACKDDDIVARWGGDEFFVLMPKTTEEEAEEAANKINILFSQDSINGIRCSISIGWDTKNKAEEDISITIKNAENYMYRHKIINSESMRSNSINTIIKTLNEKNPREEQHSKRVSELCYRIGKAIGLNQIEIGKLRLVGLLHDIGKIAIEESILNKPGKLSELEYDQIKRHPDIGYRILSTSNEMLEFADCILAHHERWDGCGYPKGLRGEAIPMVSRIIALADSYDAMTGERTYKRALNEAEAI